MKVNLGIFDEMFSPKSVEDKFEEGASLSEGVSGRTGINTEFENNLPPERVSSCDNGDSDDY